MRSLTRASGADRSASVEERVKRIRQLRRRRELAASCEALEEALAAHPDAVPLAIEGAETAMAQAEWSEAIRRWQELLERLGDEAPAIAYVRLSMVLREVGDTNSARTVISRAASLHPTELPVAVELAELPSFEEDWPTAVHRWQDVIERFGSDAPSKAYVRLSTACRRVGDLHAAAEAIEHAAEQFPDDAEVALEHAELAMATQDWPAAIDRWSRLIDQFGDNSPADAFTGLSRAHRKQGDLDRAHQILDRGRHAHPDHPALAVEHAELAMATQDWPAAIDRWLPLRESSVSGLGDLVADRIASSCVGLMDLGEHDRAAGLIESEQQRAGPRRSLMAAEGILHLRRTRFTEARPTWQRYWELGSTDERFARDGKLDLPVDTSGNDVFVTADRRDETDAGASGQHRICIYTANYGGYDDLLPPRQLMDGIDLVCFSDQTVEVPGWEIRVVDPAMGDPFMNSRRVKLLPHHYLDDYDASLYIDANLSFVRDPLELIRGWLLGRAFVARRHPDRSGAFDECEAILAELKHRPEPIIRLYESLVEERMPRRPGLVEARLLWRDHHDATVAGLMEYWWELLEEFEGRDQPHLCFAMWKTGIRPEVLPSAKAGFDDVFEKHPHRDSRPPDVNARRPYA